MTPAASATLHTDRNAARDEADRLAALLDAAEADAETQRQAACNLRDALDRVATAAGVADGSDDEVAGRVIAAIADLRERSAKPAATVEPMTEADRQRRLRAEQNRASAPAKAEPQPVATVELTPTLRYKPVAVREVPPGTPAVWLGLGDSSDHVASTMATSGPGLFLWSASPPPWAFGAVIDTTPGAPGGPVDVDAEDLARVYAVGWTDAQRAAPGLDVRTYDPASWAAMIRRLAELHPGIPAGRLRVVVGAAVAPEASPAPAPAPPVKPAPRYAPSPIDHLIQPRSAGDRYVMVPGAAVEGIPPKRVLWRSAAFNASMAANSLNRSKDARDHFGWGHVPWGEVRLWAVVDRGEPIGEEG